MFKANITSNKDLSSHLFLGGDIHKNNHIFVALNSFQQKVGQCLVSDEELDKLRDWIEELKASFKSQVILGLEDSNGNGQIISRFLSRFGYQLYEINPCLVAQRRKRTVYQDKSDENDALLVAKTLISELDNLPEIKVTKEIETAKQLKGVVEDYNNLVKNQTQVKNQLHRMLYSAYGARYQQLFKDPFTQKALRFWKSNERVHKSSLVLRKPRMAVAPSQLENIRKLRIKQKVEQLTFIREQLKSSVKLMERLFFSLPYQGLLGLGGCGLIVGSRITAEIKDIRRFKNPSKLAKYAGLSPKEHSSGQKKLQMNSGFGNRQLNRAFYQLALSQIARKYNTKAIGYYRKKLLEGKTKKQALRRLMRKNVNIVYAIMRESSGY